MNRAMKPILWTDVNIDGGFWGERQRINRDVTLPVEFEQCRRTGRMDTFKQRYTPGSDVPRPHHYWDSDVAKWIEAVAYTIAKTPMPALEQKVDEIIDQMQAAQWEDGYLNSFFSVVAPEKRWTNVYIMHELYCAGHLIEAAVAYFQATGKRKFLDIMCRYVDHIDSVMGAEDGKMHAYPGHQEIELALVRLYHVTGNPMHLRLSKFFIDERGQAPLFFDGTRGIEDDSPIPDHKKEWHTREFLPAGPYALFQSHLPVREQATAEGHAVRAMYQCSAAADLACECEDESLARAARIIWRNVTRQRMYITGGVGALEVGERFAYNYYLPNDIAYNETCACIALLFWAWRMLRIELNREYSDVMERALYNGVISGVSLSGDRFFYANHLACDPGLYEDKVSRNPRMLPYRQPWFDVACCPPNLARLIASIGGYAYSVDESSLYVHLYMQSDTEASFGGVGVKIRQQTGYPLDSAIRFAISPDAPARFALRLRVPGWCDGASIKVNGQAHPLNLDESGYARVERTWRAGDALELTLPMTHRVVEAHPAVREDCGRVAVEYGPFVYCAEQIDNGTDLFDIVLPKGAPFAIERSDMLGGVNLLRTTARRRDPKQWQGELYRSAPSAYVDCPLTLIPYYAWANRGEMQQMAVWIRQEA